MKPFIYLLLLAAPFAKLSSQNTETIMSPKITKQVTYDDLIGSDQNSLYYAKYTGNAFNNKKNLFLEKYKLADMSLEYSKEITRPDKRHVESVMFVGKQLIQFVSGYSKGTKSTYACLISADGTSTDNFVLLDEAKDCNANTYNTVFITYSADSSKFILYHLEPYGKGDNTSFTCKVFDNKLTLLHSKTLDIPNYDRVYLVNEATLDEKNNLYFIAPITPKPESKAKRECAFLCYNFATDKLTQGDLNTGELNVFDAQIRFTKDNVILAGLYSSKKEKFLCERRIEGAFIALFTKEGLGLVKKTVVQYKDLIDKDKLCDFYLAKTIIHNNTIKIMGEYRYNFYSNDKTIGSSHDYGPILVSEFQLNGTLNWTATVPENQKYSNHVNYTSFMALTSSSDLYLVYNNDGDLLFKNVTANIAKIDKAGQVTVTKINMDPDDHLQVKYNLPVKNNEAVFITKDGKLMKLIVK